MEKLTSINLKSIVAKINEIIGVVIDNSRKLDNSELVERIKALEDSPGYVYDDREVFKRISALENSETSNEINEIRKSLESLDKRVDFIRRTYSEKWQQAEFERTKFQKVINDQFYKIKTQQSADLSDINRRIDKLESIDYAKYDDSAIKNSIAEIKLEIPKPISLDGVEGRLKKLEEKPSYLYNDKPVIKEIDSIKNELSKIKKSVSDILE